MAIVIGSSKKVKAPEIVSIDNAKTVEKPVTETPTPVVEKKEVTTKKATKKSSNDTPQKDLSNQFDDADALFRISEWDNVQVTESTGFDIVDAILSSSIDKPGITLRSMSGFIGSSGIGKTTFAEQIIGNIMSRIPESRLFIFDAEKTIHIQRAASMGIDLERTKMIKKMSKIEDLFSLIKYIGEKRMEQVEQFGEEYVVKNPYFVLVDSVSAMGTDREIEADSDINKAMGTGPRMWSAMLKIYMDVIFTYNINIFFINQLRDKLTIGPGSLKKNLVYEKQDETSPGGKALPFYSFTYARLGYLSQLKSEVYGFSGVEVELNFLKSKGSEANVKVSMVFIPNKGYSNFWSNLFWMRANGMIKSAAYYRFESDFVTTYTNTWRLKESENLYNTDENFKKNFDHCIHKMKESLINN